MMKYRLKSTGVEYVTKTFDMYGKTWVGILDYDVEDRKVDLSMPKPWFDELFEPVEPQPEGPLVATTLYARGKRVWVESSGCRGIDEHVVKHIEQFFNEKRTGFFETKGP